MSVQLSRAWRRPLALVLVAGMALTGCEYDGVTSIPLPFTEGSGDDAVELTVRLREASGLTPNSEVKVDDITVGRVTDIEVVKWKPVATVSLNAGVELPANAVARVGQKSLLGAKYLELSAPTVHAARGQLADGAVLDATLVGSYPQTEQVLASLSLVLNGSGLQQVRSITEELDDVVTGREPDVRQFIKRFNVFIGSLDRQRQDIVAVIQRLDGLSSTLSRDDTVANAITDLPDAFHEIEQNRAELTRTLDAVSKLGQTANRVVRESGDDLVANLENLRPTLRQLARSGSNLTESLSVAATYPFPGNTSFPKMFQGDYANLFITLDVSPALLRRNLLQGFTLTEDGGTLMQGPPLGSGDGSPAPGTDLPDLPDGPLDPADLLGQPGGRTGAGGDRNDGGHASGSPLEGLLPGLTALAPGAQRSKDEETQ